jgi:hypothetical protein
VRKPSWRVAGAAGLAAGLTVGGFSLVSASGLERAVQAVESREGQAAPAADTMVLTWARATTAPERSVYPASPEKPELTAPPVVAVEPTAHPTATPHPTPHPTPQATLGAAAALVHGDDCSDCSDCANGVHCADSATSIDSVNSIHSVDSDD